MSTSAQNSTDVSTPDDDNFIVRIRGINCPDFSLNLTQSIADIEKDKASENQATEC